MMGLFLFCFVIFMVGMAGLIMGLVEGEWFFFTWIPKALKRITNLQKKLNDNEGISAYVRKKADLEREAEKIDKLKMEYSKREQEMEVTRLRTKAILEEIMDNEIRPKKMDFGDYCSSKRIFRPDE